MVTKKKSGTSIQKSTRKQRYRVPIETNSTVRKLQSTPRSWRHPKTWRAMAPVHPTLPKARHLLVAGVNLLKQNPKVFWLITLIYGVAMLLLVQGFTTAENLTNLKATLDSLLTGNAGRVQSTFVQLSYLFSGNSGTDQGNSGVYQTALLVICSLAMIWALRQIHAGNTITVKAAFYRGMTPLVPFLLVLAVIGLQLLPLTLASLTYSNLIVSGIAAQGIQQIVVAVICLLLFLWSLRMVSSSVFALYIVTLPDMEPRRALRSAKQLVAGRRLLVWRKVIFLGAFIVVGSSLAILPFLLFLTPLAVWVFFGITACWLPLVHSYFYSLYRELLA